VERGQHDVRVQAQALAQVAHLDLPADRLATLAESLAVLLVQLQQLRAIDAKTYEPPVITVDGEVPA
jgi:hypothetical protein